MSDECVRDIDCHPVKAPESSIVWWLWLFNDSASCKHLVNIMRQNDLFKGGIQYNDEHLFELLRSENQYTENITCII